MDLEELEEDKVEEFRAKYQALAVAARAKDKAAPSGNDAPRREKSKK